MDEEPNLEAKALILEVVDNQIEGNDPPEAGIALTRLIADGNSEENAKLYIAQALSIEIWDTMRGNPHNHERYTRNLENLPEEPSEE